MVITDEAETVENTIKNARVYRASHLADTIAHRIGRFLERQGLLVRDAENSYLAGEHTDIHGIRLVDIERDRILFKEGKTGKK
jgi:hypothetical protein